MKIMLTRALPQADCTIGVLTIQGKQFYTMEDRVREDPLKPVSEWKIPGKTAIPRGMYQVIITFSNRFKKELPILLKVPGFEGVRIHTGNTAENTEGCILLGKKMGTDGKSILYSRQAMDEFMPMLESILERDDVWIDIK